MSEKTKIEWTDATWNPTTGCNKVSPGCKNCYAKRDWRRLSSNPNTVYFQREFEDVQTHSERLDQPLRWTRPRRIFVNSMSDLFHDSIPYEFIASVFAVMMASTRHTYQILTKRPQRALDFFHWLQVSAAREYDYVPGFLENIGINHINTRPDLLLQSSDITWPLPNVWLGVSVEDQIRADERRELLREMPTAVPWVSYEPAVGDVDWTGWEFLKWLVCGFESGNDARPGNPDWARNARDFCTSNQIPFLFKQWGEYAPFQIAWPQLTDKEKRLVEIGGNPKIVQHWEAGVGTSIRIGKRRAGRTLDGRTWEEYPK